MSLIPDIGRYFAIMVLALMTVGAIAIIIAKLVLRQPKPMLTESCRIVPWLVFPGLAAFLAGLWLVFLPGARRLNTDLALAAAGLVALFAGTVVNALAAKRKRKAWPVAPAKCIDQQLQVKRFALGDGGVRTGWMWRLVCEFNYQGQPHRVSPRVHWSDFGQAETPFWDKGKAEGFIAGKISGAGDCKLRVNPSNPAEAELL